MNVIPTPPNPAELKADEITIDALRLMKCFFQLRSRAEREQLIMFAQQLLERDSKGPVKPGG